MRELPDQREPMGRFRTEPVLVLTFNREDIEYMMHEQFQHHTDMFDREMQETFSKFMSRHAWEFEDDDRQA